MVFIKKLHFAINQEYRNIEIRLQGAVIRY